MCTYIHTHIYIQLYVSILYTDVKDMYSHPKLLLKVTKDVQSSPY